MKKAVIISIVKSIGVVLLCLNMNIGLSQNVVVTDDDAYTAHSSAMLDVKSLTKGMLIPRLTQTQRDAISSPADGLLIYQTDNVTGIYYYQGSWKMLGAASGDNLGNHIATENIQLNNNWLSNDGGNEGIYIDINGKVGIGTTSPGERLTVIESTALGLTENDKQELMRIQGQTPHSRRLRYSLRRTVTEAAQTWHNTAIRVEGNVDDHVSGQSWMEYRLGTNTLQNSIAFGEGIDASGEWMIIKDGNVGIGTSSPSYKLDVNGEITSRTATGFRLRNTNYSTLFRNDNSSYLMLLTNSGDPDGSWNSLRPFHVSLSTGNVFLGNGTLSVIHDGNVGIGTGTPTARLEIQEEAYL